MSQYQEPSKESPTPTISQEARRDEVITHLDHEGENETESQVQQHHHEDSGHHDQEGTQEEEAAHNDEDEHEKNSRTRRRCSTIKEKYKS